MATHSLEVAMNRIETPPAATDKPLPEDDDEKIRRNLAAVQPSADGKKKIATMVKARKAYERAMSIVNQQLEVCTATEVRIHELHKSSMELKEVGGDLEDDVPDNIPSDLSEELWG